MDISDVNENTLRIIKAANRSLQFHQERLGKVERRGKESGLLQKDQSKPGVWKDRLPGLKSRLGNSGTEGETPSKEERSDKEPIEKTQEKVRELEDRISKILEYSSVLEETLKQNIDRTNKSHCCCSKQTHAEKLSKSKIASLISDVVISLNRKKVRQPQVRPKAVRHELHQRPKFTRLAPESLLESLSNSILEICIEDIITSIDSALHNFSVQFIRDNPLGAETTF